MDKMNKMDDTTRMIMIAGSWRWAFYEEAIEHGFKLCGWSTCRFVIDGGDERSFDLRHPCDHQRKLSEINEKLVFEVQEHKPNALFFYRGATILPRSIKAIRKSCPNTAIIFYHNDNPYRKDLKTHLKYFYFLHCLKFADLTYVYRPSNLVEAARYSRHAPKLLMPYFYSKTDLCDINDDAPKTNEVIYIGHYENDGREVLLDILYKHGIPLHVYGPEWDQIFKKYRWQKKYCHGPVYDRKEYLRIIRSSWFALVLLSARNQDVYTRRCFEIPACGSIMMAPRTRELLQIYPQDVAAVYYDSANDIVEKLLYYRKHREALTALTSNSFKAVQPHSEIARAKQIIADIELCK